MVSHYLLVKQSMIMSLNTFIKLIQREYYNEALDLIVEKINSLSDLTYTTNLKKQIYLTGFEEMKNNCTRRIRPLDTLIRLMINAFNGIKPQELFSYLSIK
jgi:hypothetical protein